MTSDLQQTRYDQLMRRVGGIIGPGSKVSEVLTELFPTLDVESVPGELLLLNGTALCMGAANITSAAGENPRVQLFNPATSGKLVTVSSFSVAPGANLTIHYATGIIALTTGIGTEVFRDRRLSAVARPSAQIRTDSTVAQTDGNGIIRVLNNTTAFIKDENSIAILPPGSGFEVGSTANATQIRVTFNWRERVAEQSELNFP